MRFLLAAALLCAPVSAASITVTAPYSTPTAVVVQYTATTAGACTVTVTDNDGGPSVHDVDPALFTNANLDLSRTEANGFHFPVVTNGLARTLPIGGHTDVKKGLDGHWYSVALQANTDHTVTIACNGGADTGSVHVSTQNIPLASFFPEQTMANPAFRGEGSWPVEDIDYSMAGANRAYIDPITGMLMKLAYHPIDNFIENPGGPGEDRWFTSCYPTCAALLDPNSAWTNPTNAAAPTGVAANAVPASNATVTAANKPLFLPFNIQTGQLPNPTNYNVGKTDEDVRLFASGGSGSEVMRMCLAIGGPPAAGADPLTACATGTIDVPLTTTFQCQTGTTPTACEGVPSSKKTGGVYAYAGTTEDFPTSNYSGWGGGCKNTACGDSEMYNWALGSGATATGSLVSLATNTKPGFNPARPAGSPYWLVCTSGGNALVHSAVTLDYNHMQVQESGLALSGCTVNEVAAGLLVWLTNAGTAHISARLYTPNFASASGNSDAARWFCALAPTTVVNGYDCDGNLRTFKTTLCKLDGGGFYSVQADGRTCLQSNYFGVAGKILNPSNSPFFNPTTFLAASGDVSGIYRGTHDPLNYRRYNPGKSHVTGDVNDRFSYGSGPIVAPATMQANFLASTKISDEMKHAMNSGLFNSTPGLNFMFDCASAPSGLVAEFNWGTTGGNGSLVMKGWADAGTLGILGGMAFWNAGIGIGMGAAHSVPSGMNCSSITGLWDGGNPSPMAFNPATVLGGPFITYISGIHDGSGGFHGYTIPYLTGFTNNGPGQPAVMNFSSDPDVQDIWNSGPNNTSAFIKIQGAGGTGPWAALNTSLYWVQINSTSAKLYYDARLTLPVDISGFGGYPGAMTFTTSPPIWTLPMSSAAAAPGNGAVRVTMAYPWSVPDKFHSAMPMKSADPVVLPALSLTTQYWIKPQCSGCASTQFDVYTDAALTTPLLYSSLTTPQKNSFASSYVSYAEACPTDVDSSAWAFGDSGFVTGGVGKIRCITVRVTQEPCSEWSSSASESNGSTGYPCNTNPNNLRSMLARVKVGDGMYDLRDRDGGEVFRVLKKTIIAENNIELTLERFSGDLSPTHLGGACGWPAGYYGCNLWVTSKEAGWMLLLGAAEGGIGVDVMTSTPHVHIREQGHSDMAPGALPNTVRWMGSYLANTLAPLFNAATPNAYSEIDTNIVDATPYWAGAVGKARQAVGSDLGQTYASCRAVRGVADSIDMTWCLNWAGILPGPGITANGTGGGPYGIYRGANSFVSIRGTTYDLASATSKVFKITPFGVLDAIGIKTLSLTVQNHAHTFFKDKSGPSSLITDADLGYHCVALKAGECRPNSAIGDVFMASVGQSDDGAGYCAVGDSTRSTPCALVMSSYGGFAIQREIDHPETVLAAGIRRLTQGWTQPMVQRGYSNAGMTPDAKWMLWDNYNSVGHGLYGRDYNQVWYVGKIPPFPTADGVDRSTYVPITLDAAAAGAVAGDTVRARIGYGENEGATTGYCTGRREPCWTTATPSASVPFVYAAPTETQAPVTCGASCNVTLYAIPGRLAYTQIEITHSGVTTLSPLTVTTADGAPPTAPVIPPPPSAIIPGPRLGRGHINSGTTIH